MNPLRTVLLEVLESTGLGQTRAELEASGRLDSFSTQQVLRALRSLSAEGLVRTEGNTQARRYWLNRAPTQASGAGLALSAEALEAMELVAQPLHARAPTTYQREVEALSESTFARYGLRPSECETWLASQPAPGS